MELSLHETDRKIITINNITFRNINFIDIPDVMYVNRVSLPENYSRYTFIALYRLFKDISYVAVDEKLDKVVGYIINKEDEGKSFFNSNNLVRKGHVFSIAVLPEYRRKHIGKILLALGMKAMFKKGLEEVYLEVRVSNTPAIKLYEKFGMEKVGVVKKYYSDGEDAYIMATNVKKSLNTVLNILETVQGETR